MMKYGNFKFIYRESEYQEYGIPLTEETVKETFFNFYDKQKEKGQTEQEFFANYINAANNFITTKKHDSENGAVFKVYLGSNLEKITSEDIPPSKDDVIRIYEKNRAKKRRISEEKKQKKQEEEIKLVSEEEPVSWDYSKIAVADDSLFEDITEKKKDITKKIQDKNQESSLAEELSFAEEEEEREKEDESQIIKQIIPEEISFEDSSLEEEGEYIENPEIKEFRRTKSLSMQMYVIIGIIVLCIILAVAVVFQTGGKEENPSAENYKKFENNIRKNTIESNSEYKAQLNTEKTESLNDVEEYNKTKLEEKEKQRQAELEELQQKQRKQHQRRTATNGTGTETRSAKADESALDKYADMNPNAAAGGGNTNSDYFEMLKNIPRQDNKGGINVISSGEKIERKGGKEQYNTELKVFLKKGIRSTAGTKVVAVAKTGTKEFPEGTLFYGTASFSNKRTYITFTKAYINGADVNIEAEAMTGKDPGIPSEVTSVESGNASASLKSNLVNVGGKIADNTLSGVTGGRTTGTLSSPTNDIAGKYDKDKEQYEYFVPAKTSFTIYIY